MGKIKDGAKWIADKWRAGVRWSRRKLTPSEQRQIERWEGEGGSVLDDD